MKNNLIKAAIIFIAAAVGSLATWAIIHWMPSVIILVGGVGAGYIAWVRVK